MKHLSLAVLLALGLSLSTGAGAKLVPDYQSRNFLMSTHDSMMLKLRHKFLNTLCAHYQKENLGPVAAFLNKNIDFDHSPVAVLDQALTTFNQDLDKVPGLQKPKDDQEEANNEDEEDKPHPKTKAERRAEGIKKRNADLVDQYRDKLAALAKKGADLNMPEAQKRVVLNALQDQLDTYLNKRYGEDWRYDFYQDVSQDVMPYLDMNNPFPCLYVKDAKKVKAPKAAAQKAKTAK